LKFFLDVISLKDEVDTNLLLHSLRVIGNSCADTGRLLFIPLLSLYANLYLDENRDIVVQGNHTLAIIQHFLDPELVFVAIPVIYNICMDYGMSPKHQLTIHVLLT
jgi:hypothetical protein